MAFHSSTVVDTNADSLSVLCCGSCRADVLFRNQVSTSRLFRLQLVFKRLLDLLVSTFLIVLIAPVLLPVLLIIRVTSRGPCIFSQARWGLNEEPFRCFKLRTMYVEHEDKLVGQQSAQGMQKGLLLKMKNDPRVTPFGALLRRTSFDEIPQLFNVFLGQMSLVGPRPLVLSMMEPFPEIREVRCVVRPGLTGLWQIRNRARNTSVLDMIADDVEYISHFSLLLDLKILLATPGEIIRGSGAY